MSNSLPPHGLQAPPSCSVSWSLFIFMSMSQWCYLNIPPSATLFFCLQSFLMSQLFTSGGQSILYKASKEQISVFGVKQVWVWIMNLLHINCLTFRHIRQMSWVAIFSSRKLIVFRVKFDSIHKGTLHSARLLQMTSKYQLFSGSSPLCAVD